MVKMMLSKYGFKKQYLKNSFQDCGSSNVIYFPVNDSEDFPNVIRERVEETIDILINTYEKETGCTLDLSKLTLEARINVYFDSDVLPIRNISILMHNGDFELAQNIHIVCQDSLYEPIKKYFLYQIGKELFDK